MGFDDLLWKGRCRSAAFVVVAAVGVIGGCSAKTESVEDGSMAERRAVEADVLAGNPESTGLTGTTAGVPSLVPGEEQVVRPANVPPATAPSEDKFDNDNPEHLLARCRDRSARQQTFDAIGDCRRAYDLKPSLEPQVELMKLLVTLQAYGDAEEAAKKVLAARPGDPVALYYLAWSYRGRQEYPKAIRALQRAIQAEPKRVEYVQALGMTYCLAENYGKGILTLEKALQMRPGDAKVEQMIKEARTQAAEKLAPYVKIVREKPGSYDNQAALGFMYQKYGFAQRALNTYDAALAQMPGPLAQQEGEVRKVAAQVFYNRGVVYRELGEPERGEPAIWQSMQLDPSLAAVGWYYIGLCRYDLGKFEQSIDALLKSVELAPNVEENRDALADAYDKAGKPRDAAEQRQAIAAIEAGRTAAKEEIAKQEARGGKTEEELAASQAAAVAPAAAAEAHAPEAFAPEAAMEPAVAPAAPAPAAAVAPAADPLAPLTEPAEASE
jgi:tetratricopeptide (TPR) repeat protein